VKFNLIHPSIVELYIDALSLHVLEERVDSSDDDLSEELSVAAGRFAKSAKDAEAIFGSPQIVQEQLDAFTEQPQGEA